MTKYPNAVASSALLLATGLAAACGEQATTEIATPTAAPSVAARFSSSTGLNVLECPSAQSSSSSELVGLLGGLLSVDGTGIEVSLGAVLEPTLLIVNVPISDFMEIDVTADGFEHFDFNRPVSISIDYSRCPSEEIRRGPLSVWYWDAETGAPLERMPSDDDPASKTITFTTDHLSGYVVAN